MELFAATGFGRTAASLHATVVPIWYSRVQTSLAFVRLEKPIALRAFLWSSSSSRCAVGSSPPAAEGSASPACADAVEPSDPPEPPHLSLPVKESSCL